MEFRTGGREGEIFLAELTGTVNNQPVYYSSDNVFNIHLVTDSTVIQSGGFRISWTTGLWVKKSVHMLKYVIIIKLRMAAGTCQRDNNTNKEQKIVHQLSSAQQE